MTKMQNQYLKTYVKTKPTFGSDNITFRLDILSENSLNKAQNHKNLSDDFKFLQYLKND